MWFPEAIRSRNHQLAERLEQIGARRHVEESVSPFEAAAIASTEIGDLTSLQRILDTILRFRPLITAIRNRKAEAIALDLGPALAAAVSTKRKEVVKLLVDNGAGAGFSSVNLNPLAKAMELGDDEMIEILLSGRISSLNNFAFQDAITKDSRYLGTLLEAYKAKSPAIPGESGCHLLFHAIKFNNIRALRLFLAAGLDANDFQTGSNLSPLGYAATGAHSLGAIRVLTDVGANVNSIAAAPHRFGQVSSDTKATAWPREIALLVAIRCGKKDVVTLPLERGADANRAARMGVKRLPLQAACERGSWEMVQILLEKGADVDAAPA
ncbi:hypothetical protein GGTG_08838 [Gaeumannomyces tritici R3-111a-1]|uniref:Uncharacterized protein n=1 Tax=Gaeumannomyces tritici (strain R3-111a-1) TaxID=644352 RepID=J3P5P8_GAET3|nr:hypothetical protein GGTG_08838 [Gaeumannomyces tritici R3-111a-1]EJT75000.1 hypothetical protein GGTG_08838 [Gaeumannomyces tritici R3-111a-1]